LKTTFPEDFQTELLEMKIPMSEMKYALDEVNKRLDISKEKISKFEGITMEVIQNKQKNILNE